VSKVRLRIAMSLDGFTAGPAQSVENPMGIGGMRLHEWVFPLAVWRRTHGEQGGIDNASSGLLEEVRDACGATIMGRHMFGGAAGPWRVDDPWNGWWGANPPFHHPVYVLTHHPREPLAMDGGTTFHFVTEGYERALELAAQSAGGKDVLIGGGANVARQYLRAGVVDEMTLHVVPVLLGVGEALFSGLDDLYGLKLARTVTADDVTHLVFERR